MSVKIQQWPPFFLAAAAVESAEEEEEEVEQVPEEVGTGTGYSGL